MFNRSSRSNLLIEVNPYQILVAGFSRPALGPLVLNCAAAFGSEDDLGLRQWLDRNFEKENARVPSIGGVAPPGCPLHRGEPLLPTPVHPAYITTLFYE